MNLIASTTQAVNLTLTDSAGSAVDLTGVTEVRVILMGPVIVGPLVCTVTNATAGIVSVPLSAVDKTTSGNYKYEVEARWGNTRLSGIGAVTLRPLQPPAIGVIQGDTPTITLQVPGISLTTAISVAFVWGATPDAANTAIGGILTIPPAGGSSDQVAITLSATDTAAAGSRWGRLLIDGVYTTPVRINIQAQGLI